MSRILVLAAGAILATATAAGLAGCGGDGSDAPVQASERERAEAASRAFELVSDITRRGPVVRLASEYWGARYVLDDGSTLCIALDLAHFALDPDAPDGARGIGEVACSRLPRP